MVKRLLTEVTGIACVSGGAWWAWPPAGLIVLGVLLIVAANQARTVPRPPQDQP